MIFGVVVVSVCCWGFWFLFGFLFFFILFLCVSVFLFFVLFVLCCFLCFFVFFDCSFAFVILWVVCVSFLFVGVLLFVVCCVVGFRSWLRRVFAGFVRFLFVAFGYYLVAFGGCRGRLFD